MNTTTCEWCQGTGCAACSYLQRMPNPAKMSYELAQDIAVDKIADTLKETIGYADTFEAREMGREIMREALLQWEQDSTGTS